MSMERWSRVKEVLGDALELPREQRAAFVEAVCQGDQELRRQVDTYLAEESLAAGFIEQPIFVVPRGDEPDDDLETGENAPRLGPYRLIRRLGRGGMGTVYLAERDDGELDHRVAIKILKRGLDTDELVRRFRTERQILARLEHPNVARFLDAGTTSDGRPYFVMEYIDGEPLDAWCDEHRLGVRDRIEIFRQVLEAVGFAHRNLVVHRDLKPENILVTPEGTPKLLDFGVAKLLYDGVSARTTLTTLGPGPMTPSYASPEQVRGEAISTATDIYSLGVVLYELLTGRPPYKLTSHQSGELARVIGETAPRRPSEAVDGGKSAPDLGDANRNLRRKLRGDLDNVVLKALSKEPERRFSSVEQLSEDLRRYLVGLPVRSRPGGRLYRAGKFVKRNGMAVSLGLSLIVLGIAFAVTLMIQRIELVKERDRAQQTINVLEGFVNLIDRNFQEGETHYSVALETLATGLETDLADQPQTRALLQDAIGRIFTRLMQHDRAEIQLRRALEDRRELLGGEHPLVAESLHNLANLETEQHKFDSAEIHMREALEIQRRAFPDGDEDLARGLHNLASLLRLSERFEEAEASAREALAMKAHLFGTEQHPELASTLNVLGTILRKRGKLDDAEAHYRRALDLYRSLGTDMTPGLARALNNLGGLLSDQKRFEEALPHYRDSLRIRRRINTPVHQTELTGLANEGRALAFLDRAAEAKSTLQDALEIALDLADDPAVETVTTAKIKRSLAMAEAALGNANECERLAREALSFFLTDPGGYADLVEETRGILASCNSG